MEKRYQSIVITFGKDVYYFYDSNHDGIGGFKSNLFSVNGLTLAKVDVLLEPRGIDIINNFKVNISLYLARLTF
jgi:hypothetical protein